MIVRGFLCAETRMKVLLVRLSSKENKPMELPKILPLLKHARTAAATTEGA